MSSATLCLLDPHVLSNLVVGDTNGNVDVFVRDLVLGVSTRVSVDSAGVQGNDGSRPPAISADGRFVAFTSTASNLVPGDTNGIEDVFVKDLQTGAVTLVSAAANGTVGNDDSIGPSVSWGT